MSSILDLQNHHLHRWEGLIRKAHVQRLMDPWEFLNALGDAPHSMTDESVEALASQWDREARRAIDSIAPECLVTDNGDQKAPWLTEDLHWMKHQGRQLVQWCKKTKVEEYRILATPHCKTYPVVISGNEVFSHHHCISKIVSSRPLLSGTRKVLKSHCDQFAIQFADKDYSLYAELDSKLTLKNLHVLSVLSSLVSLSLQFHLRMWTWNTNSTTCRLDPDPIWLI